VWTRDLVQSVTALVAAGDAETARRALTYLAASQQNDGGFPQNAWIDGEPYWTGIQLDEVALPVLLTRRLFREGALEGFDPYPMVLAAAGYLLHHGPATEQDRWEEVGGYSPATLANNVAALVCAAAFARERGDAATGRLLEEYADFVERHIERWTVTTEGALVPGISRHYIRILPVEIHDPHPDEDPNRGQIILANTRPGDRYRYEAKDIVDAGFLELVRFGVRQADDPLIVDSLQVVDAVLRVETPCGPAWHRYNHDGYGQRDDGGPFQGWGRGRAWPLLTGERGHYELAAGRDARPYARALEAFASSTGLLPEQVWDEADRPEIHMYRGRPTGAAMPLMWAHAEYIKLVRSIRDGRVFDLVPEVYERYARQARLPRRALDFWKLNRQITSISPGVTLRILAPDAFRLHWSADEWQTVRDTESGATAVGVHIVDIDIAPSQRAPIRFTFLWTGPDRWEGRDYIVEVR
jgi:glucoamylase